MLQHKINSIQDYYNLRDLHKNDPDNVIFGVDSDESPPKFYESDYNQFYEDAMGGFESLGESDSYSDEEEPDSDDSINDFIFLVFSSCTFNIFWIIEFLLYFCK